MCVVSNDESKMIEEVKELLFDNIFGDDERSDAECEKKYMEAVAKYGADCITIALKVAVRHSRYQFVADHIEEIHFDDEDHGQSYLEEATDELIEQMLYDAGAKWDASHYDGYSFAITADEAVIVSLTENFQREILDVYCTTFGLAKDILIKWIANPEVRDRYFRRYYEFQEDMEAIGVISDGYKLSYKEMAGEDDDYLLGLIETLGYNPKYKGKEADYDFDGVWYIE